MDVVLPTTTPVLTHLRVIALRAATDITCANVHVKAGPVDPTSVVTLAELYFQFLSGTKT